MKKQALVTISVLLIAASLCFFCDKNPADSDNGNGNGGTNSALVGTWNSTTGTGKLVITSNIAQTAFDVFGEGIGQLNVTGDHPATLNYLMGLSAQAFFALNQPFMPGDEDMSNASLPLYMLSVSGGGAGYGARISETDSTMYTGPTTGLDYDSTSHTLTAANVELTSTDQTQTVTVNGTLSNRSVNVSANTPTEVTDMTAMMGNMAMTIILNEDSTFTNIMTEDGEPDTTTGMWYVSGNALTIIDELEEGGQTVYDTTDATYSLNGNNLTVSFDQDMEDDEDPEAMQGIEAVLGMQPNSLTAAMMRITMNYIKQ